jgi:hypothetical protein
VTGQVLIYREDFSGCPDGVGSAFATALSEHYDVAFKAYTFSPIVTMATTSGRSFGLPGEVAHPGAADLLLGASAVPIDDVDQLPGILAELELKLTLFVDDQLGSRVQNAAALVLIRVV